MIGIKNTLKQVKLTKKELLSSDSPIVSIARFRPEFSIIW